MKNQVPKFQPPAPDHPYWGLNKEYLVKSAVVRDAIKAWKVNKNPETAKALEEARTASRAAYQAWRPVALACGMMMEI
jgi:hypothetical protein